MVFRFTHYVLLLLNSSICFLNRIVTAVKQTSSARDYTSTIAGRAVKDSAIRVQWMKFRCRREDGHLRCACAIRVKKSYQRNATLVLVSCHFLQSNFVFQLTKFISLLIVCILWCPLLSINQFQKDVTQSLQNSPPGAFNGSNAMTDDQDIRVRKYGEVVYNTLSSVASVLEYPKGKTNHPASITMINNRKSFSDLIKDSARPSYWVPDKDNEANICCVCTRPFGTAEELISNAKKRNGSQSDNQLNESGDMSVMASSTICDRRRHHCRSCGQAVCDFCSQNRRPVPERGWVTEVRVCDTCNKKPKAEWMPNKPVVDSFQ